MGHVVGEIDLLRSGFWRPFSPISGHKTSQFSDLLLLSLREALRIPVYDWKMPILQSGELQIKQNLMSKIEPA